MKRISGMKSVSLLVVAFFAFSFVGCTKYASQEELVQMEAIKKEITSLEKDANSLKAERSKLEKEIAERNKKLEECAKLKQETQANLSKMNK